MTPQAWELRGLGCGMCLKKVHSRVRASVGQKCSFVSGWGGQVGEPRHNTSSWHILLTIYKKPLSFLCEEAGGVLSEANVEGVLQGPAK